MFVSLLILDSISSATGTVYRFVFSLCKRSIIIGFNLFLIKGLEDPFDFLFYFGESGKLWLWFRSD